MRLVLMVVLTLTALFLPPLTQHRSSDADAAVLERAAVELTSVSVDPEPSSRATPQSESPLEEAAPLRARGDSPPTGIVPVTTPAVLATAPAAVTFEGDAPAELSPELTGCVLPESTTTMPGDTDSSAEAIASEVPEGTIYLDTFESERPEWRFLAGDWTIADGTLTQTDSGGYDLLTELAVSLPDAAAVSVDLTANGGPLGGGIMVGQPTSMLRAGATIIDFTDGGRFLRWGIYDTETGVYRYLSGVTMSSDFDPLATHELTVELRPDRTTILVNGSPVGVFGVIPEGQIGLVTSASSVSFDNFVIRSLAEETPDGS